MCSSPWQYDNLEDLLADVNQMVTNACLFNEEGSQVYTVRYGEVKGRLSYTGVGCMHNYLLFSVN